MDYSTIDAAVSAAHESLRSIAEPLADWPHAWIDPKGRYFPVGRCGHHTFASRFLKVNKGVEDNYAGDTLESEGWLHLSEGNVWIKTVPTQAQIDTAFDVMCALTDGLYERNNLKAWVERPRVTRSNY